VAALGPAWQNNPYLDTLVFVQRLRRRHDGFWPDPEVIEVVADSRF